MHIAINFTNVLANASTSKSYILRSTLASELIEAASKADEGLLDEELPEDDDDDETVPQTFGSIISWSTSDQLGGLGLLYVILSLILANGHVLSDRKALFPAFSAPSLT